MVPQWTWPNIKISLSFYEVSMISAYKIIVFKAVLINIGIITVIVYAFLRRRFSNKIRIKFYLLP